MGAKNSTTTKQTTSRKKDIQSHPHEDWVQATFPDPEDQNNPAVSGPTADPFGLGVANLRFIGSSRRSGRRPAAVESETKIARPRNAFEISVLGPLGTAGNRGCSLSCRAKESKMGLAIAANGPDVHLLLGRVSARGKVVARQVSGPFGRLFDERLF